MKVTVLGTGTSTGIPIPGCACEVCTSSNSRNKRLRTSIFVELTSADLGTSGAKSSEETIGRVLIDTSTDLRQQALTHGIVRIDKVLFTHTHADHTFGIDDLRSFNFVMRSSIDVYASETSAKDLLQKFRYCFQYDPAYEGGAPPKLNLLEIEAYTPLSLFGVEILPLPVLHGTLEVFAYRIGSFAYVTDCSSIPERSRACLRNLDVLILDGLRNRPHKTHFTVEQAVQEIEDLQPKRTFLTHISHELDHEKTNNTLHEITKQHVELAYDGLFFEA